jgi:hypothetical protein
MLRFALTAVVVLGLSAAGARAEEPNARPVNLDELKYALTVADKRGENVETIREAVAAFEKALVRDKEAAKAGAPSPELTALRAAVEAAAKKGENVEAISKELGRIEKALTGREYERPKEPEPKPEPEPPLRPGRGNPGIGRPGGFGGGAAGFGRGGLAGGTTSITVVNGAFTIRARLGDVTFTVTGSVDGTTGPKIVVQDGDKKTETDDIKKVPEEHRPTVERLLRMVQKG